MGSGGGGADGRVGRSSFPSPQKDWGVAVVIDYHHMNSQLLQDPYPLPPIDDAISRMGRSEVFSVLDLSMAFHQIVLADEDQAKSAFVCQRGVFEWLVMPMGISGAPARLQRIMDHLLADLPRAECYMDDILVGTIRETDMDNDSLMAAHFKDLSAVLAELQDFGFYLRLDKCELFKREVDWCGHCIKNGSRCSGASKHAAMTKWPVPRSIKEVCGFLGLTGYYSCYIANYASLWLEEREEDFKYMRHALGNANAIFLLKMTQSSK